MSLKVKMIIASQRVACIYRFLFCNPYPLLNLRWPVFSPHILSCSVKVIMTPMGSHRIHVCVWGGKCPALRLDLGNFSGLGVLYVQNKDY
ncbi:hypothetical protein QTO34_011627 [Cnephaeus nilssonii]|uniref:Uncharacterized protein n=1 Tax=Cnephaeus nilssonii TaxID=3371016 RepID=A0AA40HDU0_CNENI|nr:hypothetical protein QTO34_011627 [Eptesicus nilssonii]